MEKNTINRFGAMWGGVFILSLAVAGCGEQDCGSIDLKALSDARLPENVKPAARTFDELNAELDRVLHRTHRVVLRCSPEVDFQRDKVMPGVMLWISDTWAIRSDTSAIGKLFAKESIDPWERLRTLGIIYSRHLNDRETDLKKLLDDARVRSEFHGHLTHASVARLFDAAGKENLLRTILTGDSALKALHAMEFRFTPRERALADLEKKRMERDAVLQQLLLVSLDLQDSIAATSGIGGIRDSLVQVRFRDFATLPLPAKIGLIEQTRLDIIRSAAIDLATRKAPSSGPDKRTHGAAGQ